MATASTSASASQPTAGPSNASSKLQQAASTFKNLANQDSQHQDLADYLNASINQPYKLYLSPPWANLRKLRTLTIPDAVIQASTSAHTVASQGLFPEIERAWIIIDHQLYLWNYLEGSSSAFESYVHPTDVIHAVSLVAPKPGVFIDSIKHLLLISTQTSVTILGVSLETSGAQNSQRELRLYQTDFVVPSSGVVLSDALATKGGSRVFARGSDACLYELCYQAKEGWFSSKCSIKNHTSAGVMNLLPQWAGGAVKQSMDAIAIDDSRSLIYTLHSKRSISIYSIPAQANAPPQHITTLKDIHRTASLISPNNAALLRQEDFAIISLQPIRSQESRTICLLAVTSNGVRLFFTNQRSGYRAFATPTYSAGTTSTLELLYVRPPPANGLNPTQTPSVAPNFNESVDHPPAQPPLQRISHALYKDGIMLAAGPYAYEGGLDNVLCIGRSNATATNNTTVSPGSTSTALVSSSVSSSSIQPADSAEQATDVLVHGATWAVAEVPRQAASSPNPLVRQMTHLPRTFLVLTSSGLTVLVERRPIDLMCDLLERSSASSAAAAPSSGPASADGVGLVEVFKRHGQAQSCAMAIAVAARNSHLAASIEGLLSVGSSSSSTAATLSPQGDAVLHASRTYFDYGGAPRYEPPPYPHQPISEGRVVLSGRHDGFGIYASRLIASMWEQKLRDVSRAGVSPSSTAAVMARDLEELRAFVRLHGEAFGLQSSSGSGAAGSEGDNLAQRVEQESLRALFALVERTIEALSFVTLVGDFGWDRVLSKTSDAIKVKVEGMTLADLVLEPSSSSASTGAPSSSTTVVTQSQASTPSNVSRPLVEALIDLHSTSSTTSAGMDVIADLLQSQCPSFCDANDVRIYKALECIRQAKESSPGPRRDEALRESEHLMTRSSGRLPFERLQEVVGLWRDMDWVAGAIHLPLRCANEWDPHGLARAYREEGLPDNDSARRSAYDRAMRCYRLVLDTLRILDEKVEAAQRTSGGSGNVIAHLEALRGTAYSIVQSSPDPLLHESLYEFLLHSGRREQLLELRTPFLEAYLQQEPLTLEKLEMLWQTYTRRGQGAAAARVLVGLAESSELDLGLFQRLEYLTLAANNAKSASAGASQLNGNGEDGFHSTVSFVTSIEEKLEVAQVQVEVYRALTDLPADQLDEERKRPLLEELDAALLDISTLYRDFADPLELFDVKILIYHVADFRDEGLIADTWEQLLARAHQDGQSKGAARSLEHVGSVVVELGRRFMGAGTGGESLACPVDVLVRNLERYALMQQQPSSGSSSASSMPRHWAISTMLSAGAAPESVFDTLESLFQSKVEPWQSRSSLVFLLGDTLALLRAWLGAYIAAASMGSSVSGGSKRASMLGAMGGSGFGAAAYEDATTTALVSTLLQRGGRASSLAFPAKRIDDALTAYLVSLNSLLSGGGGGSGGMEAETRETVSGMKVLQDRLRSFF
ncbi:nucleoporin-domain-containing protein [Jaminaea rosea]|uniref:Nucleoporin-domain-containing protein n=1 Tax=Jaminaea rosea TaxID=1569628 RepID=A0A316UZH7_9BASI|nr:nucleoporin-domain-containing protein [Jaminaea rosea]PWN28575.1 nucleoporin-domain-containing protein [Jaminaea rosea]